MLVFHIAIPHKVQTHFSYLCLYGSESVVATLRLVVTTSAACEITWI